VPAVVKADVTAGTAVSAVSAASAVAVAAVVAKAAENVAKRIILYEKRAELDASARFFYRA
jgi:hypothetical protein